MVKHPGIAFDNVSNGAETMHVEARDTNDTVFSRSLQISPGGYDQT